MIGLNATILCRYVQNRCRVNVALFANCSVVSPRVSTVTGAVLGQIWKEHSLNVHQIDSILQHQKKKKKKKKMASALISGVRKRLLILLMVIVATEGLLGCGDVPSKCLTDYELLLILRSPMSRLTNPVRRARIRWRERFLNGLFLFTFLVTSIYTAI